MDGGSADNGAARRCVHGEVVDDISLYYFLVLFNHEVPVDIAAASGTSIIIFLLCCILETGDKVVWQRCSG